MLLKGFSVIGWNWWRSHERSGIYRSSKYYTISNSNSFLQILQLSNVLKCRSSASRVVISMHGGPGWNLFMGETKATFLFFYILSKTKEEGFILQYIRKLWTLSLWLLFLIYEDSVLHCVFISPYLCYPSYLLHLNANRTKMRTIFKGKHF